MAYTPALVFNHRDWSTVSSQVVAIAMDTFTDVDIFKEVIDASVRGVPVYVLLDHFHLKHFLTMAENQDVKIPQLRVSLYFNILILLEFIQLYLHVYSIYSMFIYIAAVFTFQFQVPLV